MAELHLSDLVNSSDILCLERCSLRSIMLHFLTAAPQPKQGIRVGRWLTVSVHMDVQSAGQNIVLYFRSARTKVLALPLPNNHCHFNTRMQSDLSKHCHGVRRANHSKFEPYNHMLISLRQKTKQVMCEQIEVCIQEWNA